MRVTERTADNLVIEEGASTRIVGALAMMVIGAVGILIGWTKGEIGFLIIPPFFFLYGLKLLLFNRTETHRFERWRGMLAIDSKGLLGSKRRELPLDSIADIVLEEIRGRNTPSYYIYHVTKEGERIIWAESYDGPKENTLECFNAARKFLGFTPAAVDAARQHQES